MSAAACPDSLRDAYSSGRPQAGTVEGIYRAPLGITTLADLARIANPATAAYMQPWLFAIEEEDAPQEEAEGLDQDELRRRAKAAEYLVLCDLLWRRKVDAFLVPEQPYDILFEYHGLRRLQVKSRAWPFLGTNRYYFQAPVGSRGGRGGLCAWKGVIDAFAFVAMDLGRIHYVSIHAIHTTSVTLTTRDFANRQDLSWTQLVGTFKST